MAKDVPSKAASDSNTGNTSPSISDQQKVPPLRIVLNTSGNQKSSSTAITVSGNQQQELKRDKQQDVKSDNAPKTGGRVRIKLGSTKQVSKGNTNSESSSKILNEDTQKQKVITERQDSNFKEENTANYSHLRRITRRSQRSVQTVSNEDEESISSMTSTDENQTSTTNNNSDNNNAQDTAATPTTQPSTLTSSTTTTTCSSSNAETPRRYKRRKGETSECQISEQDGAFSFQNYKLPLQNSIELYKNIRKQVDKKLKNLSSIHPKTPIGFRDYMITRGSYLLDGNKLGNGTNLFMNEDGGLHPAPVGKYHALRANRINYSVPNRAKVPLGLPVNSPLYNLFIDQEKERHRLRMQHIKEREKLTLAVEQEIVRVYNQAAMAAANQLEPFSVCTMLKHQEIYNYLDSDGFTILSRDDEQQDAEAQRQEGVRTRRRHHEQISSPTSRKDSNVEERDEGVAKAKEATSPPEQTNSTEEPTKDVQPSKTTPQEEPAKSESEEKETATPHEDVSMATSTENDQGGVGGGKKPNVKAEVEEKVETDNTGNKSRPSSPGSKESEKSEKNKDVAADNKNDSDNKVAAESKKDEPEGSATNSKDKEATKLPTSTVKQEPSNSLGNSSAKEDESPAKSDSTDESQHEKENTRLTKDQEKSLEKQEDTSSSPTADPEVPTDKDVDKSAVIPMEQDSDPEVKDRLDDEPVLSDDDRRAYNKQIFLSQLQDIDDKWDKIRNEMLIRHKNEAESLHAVQRLEWEWKTKEIGACDVRMTPIIDHSLVPKCEVFSQDY